MNAELRLRITEMVSSWLVCVASGDAVSITLMCGEKRLCTVNACGAKVLDCLNNYQVKRAMLLIESVSGMKLGIRERQNGKTSPLLDGEIVILDITVRVVNGSEHITISKKTNTS